MSDERLLEMMNRGIARAERRIIARRLARFGVAIVVLLAIAVLVKMALTT